MEELNERLRQESLEAVVGALQMYAPLQISAIVAALEVAQKQKVQAAEAKAKAALAKKANDEKTLARCKKRSTKNTVYGGLWLLVGELFVATGAYKDTLLYPAWIVLLFGCFRLLRGVVQYLKMSRKV